MALNKAQTRYFLTIESGKHRLDTTTYLRACLAGSQAISKYFRAVDEGSAAFDPDITLDEFVNAFYDVAGW